MTENHEGCESSLALPPATAEQLRRANKLLELAAVCEDADGQFIMRLGALYLARAIPEHWYTVAEDIPLELRVEGAARDAMVKRLRKEFEAEFATARRYRLLTELRLRDFHCEPLINPQTVGPNCTYGRGAPVRLSTGPNKNSSVTFLGGNRLFTTGSGHRIGRANYYQIQQSRYVDVECSEAVPLALAVSQFLEDVPRCVNAIVQKPEIVQYLQARE